MDLHLIHYLFVAKLPLTFCTWCSRLCTFVYTLYLNNMCVVLLLFDCFAARVLVKGELLQFIVIVCVCLFSLGLLGLCLSNVPCRTRSVSPLQRSKSGTLTGLKMRLVLSLCRSDDQTIVIIQRKKLRRRTRLFPVICLSSLWD